MGNYKIYFKETLPIKGYYKKGLFKVSSDNESKHFEIGISNTFLSAWIRNDSAEWGNTLIELGSIATEWKYLLGKDKDYTFITNDYPQCFQNGEEGYQKIKEWVKKQIKNLKK